MSNSLSKVISQILLVSQSKEFRIGFQLGIFCVVLISFVSIAAAAAGGLPWESPLNSIANSLSGPTAKIVGAIAIIATGLAMALGEHGAVMSRLLKIVMGLSIAFFASSVISELWPGRETSVDSGN